MKFSRHVYFAILRCAYFATLKFRDFAKNLYYLLLRDFFLNREVREINVSRKFHVRRYFIYYCYKKHFIGFKSFIFIYIYQCKRIEFFKCAGNKLYIIIIIKGGLGRIRVELICTLLCSSSVTPMLACQ